VSFPISLASLNSRKNSKSATDTRSNPQPSRAEIAERNRYQPKRQRDFRVAAAVAAALSRFAEVEAIALFGSDARTLAARCVGFRSAWHRDFAGLQRCRSCRLDHSHRLVAWSEPSPRSSSGQGVLGTGIGVSQHQVDVFLFAPDHNRVGFAISSNARMESRIAASKDAERPRSCASTKIFSLPPAHSQLQ
jgi:hypothetical protein